jgi:hypothetical protein
MSIVEREDYWIFFHKSLCIRCIEYEICKKKQEISGDAKCKREHRGGIY